MDSIQITGIRCYGYTGLIAEEQMLGQWFEVDLTLWVDLQPAGISDDIEQTLDYRKAIAIVKQEVEKSKYYLIEKLTKAIADQLLELDLVQQVQVKLSKLAAPIPDFSGKITLDIVRTKNQ